MSVLSLSKSSFSLIGICLTVLILLTACESDAERKLKAESEAKKQWILDNVKVGMTRDEVIQKLGKPDTEDNNAANTSCMNYDNDATESIDPLVSLKDGYGGCQIYIENGKVTEVHIVRLDVEGL